jgi:hypothetical protein
VVHSTVVIWGVFFHDSNKLTVKLGPRKCMEVIMGCGGPRGGLETYATVFWITKDQTSLTSFSFGTAAPLTNDQGLSI